MSAATSLDLFTPKKRPKPKLCRCGHEPLHHAKMNGACGYRAKGDCKRYRPRGRVVVEQPAHLLPPPGAIVLERDDTKNDKAMGWALVGPHTATIYLSQLRTRSPNKSFFGFGMSKQGFERMHALQAKYKEACRDRVTSAIAQCGVDVAARGRPAKIVITRVSTGTLDGIDNLVSSQKFVVDGIAIALNFNDAELAHSASRAGSIVTHFEQEKPGKKKVCGVRIQLWWAP